MKVFRQHSKCRVCDNSDLEPVIDFGKQALANDYRNRQFAGESIPLCMLFCEKCKLGQLSTTVSTSVLYSRYAYVTSRSLSMRAHLGAVWKDCTRWSSHFDDIFEVGSNDGFCLRVFKTLGAKRVTGLEPAANLVDVASKSGIETIHGVLSPKQSLAIGKLFDLIIIRHVFCHIDKWHDAMESIKVLMRPNAQVYIEVPHIKTMVEQNEWDTIYHEHLSYMSVTAISRLCELHGLEVSDVKHYPIHGGSIGVFVHKKGVIQCSKRVAGAIVGERRLVGDALRGMPWERDCEKLNGYLNRCNVRGFRVIGFGAPAKAAVVCACANLGGADIMYVTDSTLWKQGRFIPGTDIPILPPIPLEHIADVAVMFPWNYQDEILSNHSEWINKGGRFIKPSGNVRLIP